MHHPGHHQEPWQQVKIPFATAGSAATWLSALDPIYQPSQTCWAPPVLQASAVSLHLLPHPEQQGTQPSVVSVLLSKYCRNVGCRGSPHATLHITYTCHSTTILISTLSQNRQGEWSCVVAQWRSLKKFLIFLEIFFSVDTSKENEPYSLSLNYSLFIDCPIQQTINKYWKLEVQHKFL